MEDFYRHMRLKKKVLVQDNKPIGGKWNFDHENRKKWNPDDNKANHISFNHDVTNLMNEVIENKISYIGNINLNNFGVLYAYQIAFAKIIRGICWLE